MRAVSAPGTSNEQTPRGPLDGGRNEGRHRGFRRGVQHGSERRCMEGRRQGRRCGGADAATCASSALGMRRWRSLGPGLTAVLCVALLCGLMVRVTGRGDGFVHACSSLSNGHRSAALEGQHRDREPKKKAEEHAHDLLMVPQIKSMHQGTASGTLVRTTLCGLGLVRILKTVGLYRHSRTVH